MRINKKYQAIYKVPLCTQLVDAVNRFDMDKDYTSYVSKQSMTDPFSK